MSISYQQVLKIAALGVMGALLLSQIKQMLKLSQVIKEVKKADVKCLREMEQTIERKDTKSSQVLLKLQPYYFQVLNKQVKIRALNKFYAQPSDTAMVQQVKSMLNKDGYQLRKQKELNYPWFAKSHQHHLPYVKIQGFGQVVGDFFQVKRSYEHIHNLSYWNRFRDWLIRKNFFMNRNQVGTRRTFGIYGPIVGILSYQIGLMMDSQIVAMCKIQDGRIIPTVTAVSKNQIIRYYESKLSSKYVQVGLGIVATIVLCRWLWTDIKHFINMLKLRREKIQRIYFNPKDNIADDKLCIICYTNCRNLIFFDCRHMIMCLECSYAYKSEICPYCKLEIEEMKIIVEMNH